MEQSRPRRPTLVIVGSSPPRCENNKMVCMCTCLILGVIAFLTYLGIKYYYLEPQYLEGNPKRPVLITGCDSGFGRLLALKLLKLGCPVYAGCLTQTGQDELKSEGKGLTGTLVTVPLDVTSDQSVKTAHQSVQKSIEGKGYKGLWGLVNNAGILGASGPDDWLNVNDYQSVLDVNTLGVIRVTQIFKPLVKQSEGRIVTVASVAGRVSPPFAATYGVSKYAVEAYCDAIRLELQPFKVSVHILEPGFFATNITDGDVIGRKVHAVWDRLDQSVKDEYGVDYTDQFIRATKKTMVQQCSPRLDFVVDAYTHALLSKYPRTRYNPGYDSKLFYLPLSFLPGAAQDSILLGLAKLIGIPTPKRDN